MKKNLVRLLCLAVLFGSVLTACSEKEDMVPEFPEKKNYIVEMYSGENSCGLFITANMDWTISIPASASAAWALMDEDQQVTSISGSSTDSDLAVIITCLLSEEEVINNDDEVNTVEVSMTMGGQTQVVATVTALAEKPRFNVRSVWTGVSNRGSYFIPAGDGSGLKYFYGTINGDQRMIWSRTVGGYLSYILVEATVPFKVTECSPGIVMTPLDNTGTDPWFTEYQIFCGTMHTDEDAKYSISLEPTVEVDWIYTSNININFTAPKFDSSFSLRAAMVNYTGYNFETDNTYGWFYENVTDGDIQMIWRPSVANDAVDTYLLISSWYNVDIRSDCEWVSVDDPVIVEATATDDWAEASYHIWVDHTKIESLSGDKANLSLYIAGTETAVSIGEYTVSYPDISSILLMKKTANFQFDYDGTYIPADEISGNTTTMDITSASKPVIVELVQGTDTWYLDDAADASQSGGWITTKYQWNSNSQDKIQTNPLTVEVSPNETYKARQGMVMAFPESVFGGIQTAAAAYGGDITQILFPGGGNVASEYKDYVVANISQAAHPRHIEPYESDSWWPRAGASFGELDSTDPVVSSKGIPGYVITQTASNLKRNPTIGKDNLFEINVEYNSVIYCDGNGNPVTGNANWLELAESTSNTGKYCLLGTPGTAESKAAYAILYNNGSPVVAVKLDYKPAIKFSGSKNACGLWIMDGYDYDDFSIEPLDSSDPRYPFGISSDVPVVLVTCLSDKTSPTVAIGGISSDSDRIYCPASWIDKTFQDWGWTFTISMGSVNFSNNTGYISLSSSKTNSTTAMIFFQVAL